MKTTEKAREIVGMVAIELLYPHTYLTQIEAKVAQALEQARADALDEFRVWGTDCCSNCMNGRVTLFCKKGAGVCVECENHIALKTSEGEGGG